MEAFDSLNINVGDIDASRSNINIGYFGAAKAGEDVPKLVQYRNALYKEDSNIVRLDLVNKKGKGAPKTCEWIKENETYQHWLASDESLLRILGSPGKGKTMLSIFLVEELAKTRSVLYVFCRSGQLDSATGVLRTLIWQLAGQCQNPEPELQKYLELENPQRVQDALNSAGILWALLTGLICKQQQGSVVCIVDGLDECDQNSKNWLGEHLFSQGVASSPIRLKLIVLSRPFPTQVNSTCLEVLLDELEDAQEDVRLAISTGVTGLRERVRDIDNDFAASLEARLQAKAQDTFLWVGFAMIELCECQTRMRINRKMDSLPEGLFGLYDHMILQIPCEDRQVCAHILRWVALAAEPLSMVELAVAVGLHGAGNNNVRDYVAHCGPLLVTRKGQKTQMKMYYSDRDVHINVQIVQFVHQSAKDYLLREEVATNSVLDVDDRKTPESFSIFAEATHAECARTCLQQLKSHLDRSPVNDEREHFIRTARKSPCLEYALKYWEYHARKASTHAGTLHEEFGSMFSASSNFYTLLDYLLNDQPRLKDSLELASSFGIIPWARSILAKHTWKDLFGLRVNGGQGYTPLYLAARNGHEEMTRFLLDQGANARGSRGYPPLHGAISSGSQDIVRILIRAGADVDSRNADGDTALHKCIKGRSLQLTQLLLKHGAKVNAAGRYGTTPLHTACHAKSPELVECLLSHGADVHRKDQHGQTPLHCAVLKRDVMAARILLERGADKQAADRYGWIPIRYAGKDHYTLEDKDNSEDQMFLCLLDQDTESFLNARRPNEKDTRKRDVLSCLIEDAISVDNLARIQLLESKLLCLHDGDGQTVRAEYLCRAAAGGSIAVAKYLLDEGAAIDAMVPLPGVAWWMEWCDEGTPWSPLHWATYFFLYDMIQLLLERGADANTLGRGKKYNCRPLDVVLRGQIPGKRLFSYGEDIVRKCARILISHGGKMNTCISFEGKPQRLPTQEELDLWLQ